MTRQRAARRTGANLVEFAMVLPVALLFIFGIIEFGRLLMVLHLTDNAAREGARFAVVSTGDDTVTDTTIKDLVKDWMCGLDYNLTDFQVEVYKADATTGNNIGDWNTAAFGEKVAVRITGTYEPVLPSFLDIAGAIPVQATTMMNSEAN